MAAERRNDMALEGTTLSADTLGGETEAEALRAKNRLLTVIASLLAAAAVLLGVALAAVRAERAEAPAEETPHLTESRAFTADTPAPAHTPVPRESADGPRQLGDAMTKAEIESILDRLQDVSAYMSAYNEAMWLPDNVDLYYEDIIGYERRWAGYEKDMTALLEEMDGFEPSELFKDAWDDLYAFISKVRTVAGLLSDFDMDDDGEYSKHEVMFVNNTANDRAVEAVDLIGHVEMNYHLALIDYEAAQSTPRPTARPTPQPTKKPSTSSGRSYADPYNARDYSDPDDFYFDYYDDFFDYEDAEDYWYEYGDD